MLFCKDNAKALDTKGSKFQIHQKEMSRLLKEFLHWIPKNFF